MARPISISNIYAKKFETFDFESDWLTVFGTPEKSGVWIAYGKEKNGKTWFALKLAQYISKFETVWYVSGEEGTGMNFVESMDRAGITPNNKALKIMEYTPLEELRSQLKKRRAARVVVIDNTTIYKDELAYGGFQKLRKDFPKTLFIFLAHEDRKEPYGATSKLIKKLSAIIIHIEGLQCFVFGRCPGGALTIDYDRSTLYHGTEL